MNGVHDLGGLQGFGPVVRDADEAPFHAPWEATVWTTQKAAIARGLFNLDEFRYGIERIPPADYLRFTYYEKWLASVERVLIEKGIVTADEIAARVAKLQADPGGRRAERPDPAFVEAMVQQIAQPVQQEYAASPRFRVGDAVVARNLNYPRHTRLPRYIRGKRGTVGRVYGMFPLPDLNAHGQRPDPETVYAVRFDAQELWGEAAEPGQSLSIDMWESYLDPA